MGQTINARAAVQRIRADARKIRRAEKKIRRLPERTAAQEWLRDNAYLFRTLSEDLCRSAREVPPLPRGANRRSRLEKLCASLCSDPEPWTQERLYAALRAENLCSAEVQALPFMLRMGLLQLAAAGTDNADALRLAVERLRAFADLRLSSLQESLSPMEKILREDPSGAYSGMDEESRALYRRLLFARGRRTKTDPDALARRALEQAQRGSHAHARHIGYTILPAPKRLRGAVFLTLQAVLPLAAAVAGAVWLRRVWVAPLLFLPLWGLFSPLLERLSVRGVDSMRLPRMDLGKAGENERTLLTVSAILPPAEQAARWREHLTQLYLSNGQENIKVCLLADLKTAGTPVRPEDKGDVAAMARLIAQLNAEYGGGFLLAVRARVYAPTEGCYTGWERKRGAITQLVRLICTGENAFEHLSGDLDGVRQTQYLLALDSDTQLPMDAAMEMLRVAAHPLHQPVVHGGRVRAGYGVLSPLVRTRVRDGETRFQRIFSPDSGLSAYDNVVSERYQDLFGESIFAGKGLIHVRAFYETLDHALPQGCVLSHDSVEGGYLRCGFLSDVQVADGFPRTQQSFFDRMERWIRGDWQNMRFLFSRSPLSLLSRFKLLDNMRRDVTPAVNFLGLVLCVFLPHRTALPVFAVCLASVAGAELIGAVHTILTEGMSALTRMFYADAVPPALAQMLRGVLQVVMLPLQAICSASAVCRAVYRSAVSHRRLLEWTTFAQSESASSRRRLWTQCLYTAAFAGTLFVSGKAELKLLAILFFLNIPFLLTAKRSTHPPEAALSDAQREQLRSWGAAMWDYFAENCDFSNNYLPPDNVQETPVWRVARRTSPTNIGLGLLCVLAARDLGYIDTQELCARLERTLGSIEQLQTYGGNLLNWYDTRTLRPLEPRYVSTVDCGNFLCCLKTLQQGIAEYEVQHAALADVSRRIQTLLDRADLTALYDSRRRLFHIGMDPHSGKASASYYDMLMSEARMTGYYAIACRAIPKKHWAALSRTMCRVGRHGGLLSWTGTTFEYFMPYLFLPAERGTLSYEALKFCIRCQRKRVRRGLPFGISESGFYAFDRDLNYQYKAHGVQALGLRQDLDRETVIAPYASFLMMQMEPRTAMRNLKRLERMQMSGRWGFYEALDCTPEHTDGKPYAVVRSYMAHHVGMSLLSVLNVLHDGVLRERFMRDRQMRAARSLLEEGVPVHARAFKNRISRDTPVARERLEQAKREIRQPSLLQPNCRVLRGAELSVCLSDSGACMASYRGASLFRHSRDLLSPSGAAVVLQGAQTVLPFARMVKPDSTASFRCVLGGTDVRYAARQDDLLLRVRVRVHPTIAALEYTISVRSASRQPFDGSVLIYAEPTLTAQRPFAAHPAFSKLFIEDRLDEAHEAVLFRRRERDGSKGVCMAAGFLQQTAFTCTRSKASALRDGYGLSSLAAGNVHFTSLPGSGDCCLGLEVPVHLSPRGAGEWKLLLTAASTEREALDQLLHIRKEGMHKGAGGLFQDGRMEAVLAEKMLPGVVFGARDAQSRLALRQNTFAKRHIWRFGISGEQPIVYRRVTCAEDIPGLFAYIRAVHRLNRAGFGCDLVIGYTEGGAYDSPLLRGIRGQIREACGTDNVPQIIPVDLTCFSEADEAFLAAMSVFTLQEREETLSPERLRPVTDVQPMRQDEKLYAFTDGGIEIPKDAKTPYLPWSMVLCGSSFGTLVTDKSLGFTWAINAHELQLTPWRGEIGARHDAERLFLCANGRTADMIRCASVFFSPDGVRWEGAFGDIRYSVLVPPPGRALRKVCRVVIRASEPQEVRLIYGLQPVLGADPDFAQLQRQENGVLFHSPDSPIRAYGYLAVSGGADAVYTNRAEFALYGAQIPDRPWAGVEKKLCLTKNDQTVEFTLSFGARQQAAIRMACVPSLPLPQTGRVHLHSADPAIDALVNTWLPWQIRACRFSGRTGFYQCGGAWGFRDQLQDASALLWTDPQTVRRHLLRCAAVQFTQGDVLHWWHRLSGAPQDLRGVRTRYRDDLLWLAWLAAEYVRVTGDRGVLDVQVPFLQAEPLSDNEKERYFSPAQSTERAPLLQHCMRAVDFALQKGSHGLVLMGGGDWNDGMDRIGESGTGESVWLSMFMIDVLAGLQPIVDAQTAERYAQQITALRQAVERHAWDGDHYLRAFMDDGTPVGKSGDSECAIDSIAQSFSLAAGLSAERVRIALQTAAERLWDQERGIVKLLEPPFSGSGKQVGYLAAYPPGIRENGGQYTHAAVWLCGAILRTGRIQEGLQMLRTLSPAHFCADAERMARYGGEPYALAGDIPAAERDISCTGWTLYTGSAAWMYRLILEIVLGMRIEQRVLYLDPRADESILPVSLHINIFSTDITIQMEAGKEKKMTVNGKKSNRIPLDGERKRVFLCVPSE